MSVLVCLSPCLSLRVSGCGLWRKVSRRKHSECVRASNYCSAFVPEKTNSRAVDAKCLPRYYTTATAAVADGDA